MTPLVEANGVSVFHCDWRALLGVAPSCDTLIVDAPYSERTHAGHDAGTAQTSKVWQRTNGNFYVPANRRSLSYEPWGPEQVGDFVKSWNALVGGWIVSITDDVLAPVWQAALDAAGRYAFAPLAFVAPGSRVRLVGDGPSNWTTWIVVARPRTKTMAQWGTLPGAYVLPPGHGGALPVVGGKPLWLMQRLVEDYSRPGDLVVDPCCGAGTTAVAAIRSGRRAIVGDSMLAHAELAAQWVRNPWRDAPNGRPGPEGPQGRLFK